LVMTRSGHKRQRHPAQYAIRKHGVDSKIPTT
jgi:hypothetical protein